MYTAYFHLVTGNEIALRMVPKEGEALTREEAEQEVKTLLDMKYFYWNDGDVTNFLVPAHIAGVTIRFN